MEQNTLRRVTIGPYHESSELEEKSESLEQMLSKVGTKGLKQYILQGGVQKLDFKKLSKAKSMQMAM